MPQGAFSGSGESRGAQLRHNGHPEGSSSFIAREQGWPSEIISKLLYRIRYFCFSEFPLDDSAETGLLLYGPVPLEGRLAIVTNAGRDAVDALALIDEQRVKRTAKPCGPDAPTLASSS